MANIAWIVALLFDYCVYLCPCSFKCLCVSLYCFVEYAQVDFFCMQEWRRFTTEKQLDPLGSLQCFFKYVVWIVFIMRDVNKLRCQRKLTNIRRCFSLMMSSAPISWQGVIRFQFLQNVHHLYKGKETIRFTVKHLYANNFNHVNFS